MRWKPHRHSIHNVDQLKITPAFLLCYSSESSEAVAPDELEGVVTGALWFGLGELLGVVLVVLPVDVALLGWLALLAVPLVVPPALLLPLELLVPLVVLELAVLLASEPVVVLAPVLDVLLVVVPGCVPVAAVASVAPVPAEPADPVEAASVAPAGLAAAVELALVSVVVPAGAGGVLVVGLGFVISERLVLMPSGAPPGRTPPGLPPRTGGLLEDTGGLLVDTGGVVTFATGGAVCFGGELAGVTFGVEAVVVLGFFTGGCTTCTGSATGFSIGFTGGGVVAFTGGGVAGLTTGVTGATAVGVSVGFSSGVTAVSGGVCSGGFAASAEPPLPALPVLIFSSGETEGAANGVTCCPNTKGFDCASFCVHVWKRF